MNNQGNDKKALAITDSEFEARVLKGQGVSLVDFWAEWCGPCRAIAPLVEELAGEYAGRLGVYKLDVDSNPETPARYQIRGIPTLLVFKGGQLVDQIVGAVPREVIASVVDRHVDS